MRHNEIDRVVSSDCKPSGDLTSTARSLSLCDFAARVVDVTVVVPTAYLEQGHIKDKMLVNVLGGGKNVIPLTRVPYWTL